VSLNTQHIVLLLRTTVPLYLHIQVTSLQRRGTYFSDGSSTRLDRSMLLTTRECGNKRGGT